MEENTKNMYHYLDKLTLLFFCTWIGCSQPTKQEGCNFDLDENERVQTKGVIPSHFTKKTKIYLLKEWLKDPLVLNRTHNFLFSKDSTVFSSKAMFPFTIIHPSEKDTIYEEAYLKFDIHIELKDTSIKYYFLDYQLYYETPENPFLGAGRMKGVNDKEFLNKYTKHCNPNKETRKAIEENIKQELKQVPRFAKTPPPEEIVNKYVNRIINQAKYITLKATEETRLTTTSLERAFQRD